MRVEAAPALAALSTLSRTVSEASSDDAIYNAVASTANDLIGHRLFTIMAFDASAMQVQRVYSSNPDAYPTGGRKDKRETAWGQQVLEEGRPFIGRAADDIRAHFDDHAVILGLGLKSVLNVPVRLRGRTIGTMNLLHESGHYDVADLDLALPLASQLVGPLTEALR